MLVSGNLDLQRVPLYAAVCCCCGVDRTRRPRGSTTDGVVICRFVLATVFALAGVAKLPRRAEFEDAVRSYRLIPDAYVRPIARGLPLFELGCGLLLMLGLGTRIVSGLLAVCLVGFAAAISINLARGRRIDCGCFGTVTEKEISWRTVARDVVLLALALLVIAAPTTAFSLDAVIGGAAKSSMASSAGVAYLIVGTVLVLSLSLVAQAFRTTRLVRSAAVREVER